MAKDQWIMSSLVSLHTHSIPMRGSCPISRFSLVPDDANRQPSASNQPGPSTGSPDAAQAGTPAAGRSPITDILQRLWGTSGSASQTASPTSENPPPTTNQPQAGPSQPQRIYDPPSSPPPGTARGGREESEEIFYTPPSGPPPGATTEDRSSGQAEQSQEPTPAQERLPTAIPDDYRERHRQREREQSRQRDPDP
jgi:E3 ubiquitin-protein ligase RNF115/126